MDERGEGKNGVQKGKRIEIQNNKKCRRRRRRGEVMLGQALSGNLDCIPDDAFGLVPKAAEQPRTLLFSTNS